MATITGLTSAKMTEITNAYIVGGTVNGLGNLILTKKDGSTSDAGPIILAGTASQYFRGDKSWATMDKSAVGLSLVDNVSVVSDYVPKWKANTFYLAGTIIISPVGELVRAKTDLTTGTTYVPSNWASVTLGESVVRTNLFKNPSCEVDTVGYAVNAGNGGVVATSRQTSGGLYGSAFYRATWTTGTSDVTGYVEQTGLSTTGTGITAGNVYTFSAYLRTSFATSMYLKANWWNGTSSTGTSQGATITLAANTWTRVTIVGATAPASSIGVWLDYYFSTAVPTGATVDIDGSLAEQSAYLGTYFDGSTAAVNDLTYTWSGTANASTSIATSLSTAFVPKWRAGKVYAIGDQVVTSTNLIVTANVAHTASAAFVTDILKWNDSPMAKGLVYKNLVGSSTGTVVDAIVNNITTFTFRANRNYRIVWDFSYYGTGNSDSLFYCSVNFCAVGDSAALLTGLTLGEGRTKGLITSYALQSTQHTGPVVMYYNPGSSDVTTQIKFRSQRVVGDDGIIVVGNANERVQYLIHDDGAQV